MPKAASGRKAPKVEPDFKKTKIKLGKGKKAPSNATNTSFKARSIALPDQTPLARALAQRELGNTGEGTTAAGLTLDEVLARLRHPNAGAKKDALAGVREILRLKPDREVGKVMRALGGMISDEDATVRKTLLSLLEWYFNNVPEPILAPYLPLFLLQTSSALSHIFADIRLDAARLVSFLLHAVPAHITSGWPYTAASPSRPVGVAGAAPGSGSGSGSIILEGLRLALGLGGEKASSAHARLSAGGKLVLLKAVSEFVRSAIHPKTGPARSSNAVNEDEASVVGRVFDKWLDTTAVLTARNGSPIVPIGLDADHGGVAFEGSVLGSSSWCLDTDPRNDWEIGQLSTHHIDGGSSSSSHISVLADFFLQLHPLLLSTFLESAPSAFSPPTTSSTPSSASTETHIELCGISAGLTAVLARAIIAADNASPASGRVEAAVDPAVAEMLKRMSPYFPFHLPPSSAGIANNNGITAAFEINLSYAGLAVLLAPQPPKLSFKREDGNAESSWPAKVRAVEDAWRTMQLQSEERRAKVKGKGKGKDVSGWAMREVEAWIIDVLQPRADALTPQVTPAIMTSLLPIMWALLVQPPISLPRESGAQSTHRTPELAESDIGSAFLAFISRLAPTSSTRDVTTTFLIHLIQVHEQPYAPLPFFVPLDSAFREGVRGWLNDFPRLVWEAANTTSPAVERMLRFLLSLGHRDAAGAERPYSLVDAEMYPGIAAKLGPLFHVVQLKKGATAGPWLKIREERTRRLALNVARVWMEWDAEGRLAAAVAAAQAARHRA